jgi:hypothetical protein
LLTPQQSAAHLISYLKAIGTTNTAMSAADAQGLAIRAAADSVADFSAARTFERQTSQTIIATPAVVIAEFHAAYGQAKTRAMTDGRTRNAARPQPAQSQRHLLAGLPLAATSEVRDALVKHSKQPPFNARI